MRKTFLLSSTDVTFCIGTKQSHDSKYIDCTTNEACQIDDSTSIVNEQSSGACKVGNLSNGALLRTASLTSWILGWQSFRARCLDGFIDIGRFNFRFGTSSSQSPFYLQAAESASVTYCESMWGTKGSPCPFRIEMTRTGERRKKEDMMVASQAEDPKLYVAHSRSQQHRLKI